MATRVFDGINFCDHFLKRTSQRTFLPSLVQIGPAVWEEKMFREIVDDARHTMDDRHITTLKAPLEHVVLRWAKKMQMSIIMWLKWQKCFFDRKKNIAGI